MKYEGKQRTRYRTLNLGYEARKARDQIGHEERGVQKKIGFETRNIRKHFGHVI